VERVAEEAGTTTVDGISRRHVLRLGVGALIALSPVAGLARTTDGRERTLAFDNVHTGERLRATYWEGGKYLPDALGEINRLLRDYRTGEIATIEPRLLDLLHALYARLGSSKSFEVISGYRSSKTNGRLRRAGRQVSSRSLHMDGKAVDIRLPGRATSALRSAAMALRGGGVGYYPGPGFVHVDIGRVRYW